MDVLAYSLANRQAQLNRIIGEKTTCLATKCSETAPLLDIACRARCWVECIEPCLLRSPVEGFLSGYWACIPGLTGATLGFQVCDTAAQFNCGATCSWTVPSGVTRARFQLWGAGGGANKGPCCCGDAPFGSTGAYASVIIPVTVGSVYTICSGCAFCCFGSSTSGSQRIPGCPSWVTGPGLCNFCAAGGQGGLYSWMSAYGKNNPCYVATNCCTGQSICNQGGDLCFVASCSSGGIINYTPGASYYGTTTSLTEPSIVYGIRGMWPLMCFTTNNYGYQCHPPIYGFETVSRCNPSYSSGNCCGYFCRAACNVLRVPGAGGFYSHAMGGGNGHCGDMGRMGMVCVTYC